MSPDSGPRRVLDLVAGARPNFVKLAPVARALAATGACTSRIVHTGQHYDVTLSRVFFDELHIPPPDVNLEVGSGTHGAQTARILERYEAHLMADPPAATVVFGDVNSTIGCALAAVKLGIPVVHVEAGLRSFDRSMPEEVNRVLTDAISDLLFVTEPSGLAHLGREGIAEEKVRLVGNTMIDTLLERIPIARARRRAASLGLASCSYALLTLHRPSNVDNPNVLRGLFGAFRDIALRIPVVFPMHPRTRAATLEAGLDPSLLSDGVRVLEPEPYLDNLSLMADATVVLTDSGGMQEECAVLGVPCITLRDTTERPVTLEVNASRLVGSDIDALRAAVDDVLEERWGPIGSVPLWDGKAGERIAGEIVAWLLEA